MILILIIIVSLQAKWNVSITADSDQTVLFNTPSDVVSDLGSNRKMHKFLPTPPMSSYLVAFVVGKLESVSRNVPYPDGTQPDRPVSIYGTPDRWAKPFFNSEDSFSGII